MSKETSTSHDRRSDALEAARLEMVRRLEAKKLPLSVVVQRLVETPTENGSSTERRPYEVSSLNNREISYQVSDEPPEFFMFGFKEQLAELAQHLLEHTNLIDRPANLFPEARDADALRFRYLVPMTMRYLQSLASLADGDRKEVARLADELDAFIATTKRTYVRQLLLDGPRPAGDLRYRDVTLRPLTGEEAGALQEDQFRSMSEASAPRPTFMPRSTRFFRPSALLEVTSYREQTEPLDGSPLIFQTVLALLLNGIQLSSTNVVLGTEAPTWAATGQTLQPFAIGERHPVVPLQPVDEASFRDMVDLAYRIPPFTSAEQSQREVVLHRCLRGCGTDWRESSLIDFVISLEAALLPKIEQELSFKFALFGALFLKSEREPDDTYQRLRKVYRVRSRLVHGELVKPEDRREAETWAEELALAVVKKAVASGWPNPDALTKSAYGR